MVLKLCCKCDFKGSANQVKHHNQQKHRQDVKVVHHGADQETTYNFTEDRKLICNCGMEYKHVPSFKKHVTGCDGRKETAVEKGAVYTLPAFEDSVQYMTLTGVPLIISKLHKVVVCNAKNCRVGFGFNELKYHMTRHHTFDEVSFSKAIAQIKDFLEDNDPMSFVNIVNPIEPVPGLEVIKGYKCFVCQSRFFTSVAGFRNHLSFSHSMRGITVSKYIVDVQKLNHKEKNSATFPVSNSCEMVKEVSGITFKSVMGEIDMSYKYGKLPKVYESLGWHRFFETREWKEEKKVLDVEAPESVVNAVRSWFKEGNARLKKVEYQKYSLMLQIGYEKFDVMIDRQKEKVKKFGTVQEASTEKRYQQILESLVSFILAQDPEIMGEEEINAKEAVQVLLSKVFQKKYSINVSRFDDVIYRYLAYRGMEDQELEFKEPHAMTGYLAALKYFIRLFVFLEIDANPALVDGISKGYEDTILVYSKKNGLWVTPYGMVCEMMGLFSISETSLIAKSVIEIEPTGESMSFKGLQITKIGIQQSVMEALVIAKQLVSGLTFNFNALEVAEQLLRSHSWREPLRSQKRGGSFLKSEIVMKLGQKFIDSKPNFQEKFSNRSQMSMFFAKVWDFRRLLILLVHLTSGQPARATELASMTLTNSQSLKSVYWRDSIICTCTVYNKINSVTGSDQIICRFLSKDVSLLLLIDIAVLRMAERVALQSHERYDSTVKNVYDYHLWVRNGSICSAQEIREVIRAGLVEYLNLDLYLSEYRHVAIGFARTLKATSLPDEVLEMLLDHQAGHSSMTAKRCYAVTEENMARLSSDKIEKHFIASKLWWGFMGFEDSYMETSNSVSIGIPLTSETTNQVYANNLESRVKELEALIPKFSGQVVVSQEFESKVQSMPVMVVWKAKELLKQYTKNIGAEFLSAWQGYAASFCLENSGNGLVVLPTGGGKTLIVELYAYQYQERVSFLLLPTTSLYDDMIKRFARTPLKFEEFRCLKDMVRPPSIVICMIDDIMNPKFKELCYDLLQKNKLGSIFIDEIHLALEWATFRTPVHYLPMLLDLQAPLIGLTATLRKSETAALVDILGKGFRVIRHPNTLRADINYNVINFGSLGREYFPKLLKNLKGIVNQRMTLLEDEERLIILVMSKNEVRTVTELFSSNAVGHDSDLSLEEKNRAVEDWKSGVFKILVGTPGISVGIHYPYVKNVFSFGFCYSIMELVQVSGRAARGEDRKGEYSMITCEEYVTKSLGRGKNDKLLQEVKEFCKEGVCRRSFLSSIVDECPVYCEESNACDTCKKLYSREISVTVSAQRTVESNTRSSGMDPLVIIYEGMKDVIKVLNSYCPYCISFKNENQDHGLASCPNLAPFCLRCLNNTHKVADCKVAIKVESGPNFFCFGCLLPFQVDRHVIHARTNEYTLESCKIRDRAKMIAWVFFRSNIGAKVFEEIGYQKTSEHDYCKWLTKSKYPFTNMGLLLYVWYCMCCKRDSSWKALRNYFTQR